MKRALANASNGWGQTAPNPMVGAVVVSGDQLVADGWHARFGEAHAEVAALQGAGDRARGATLYVTIEPCLMCVGAMLHARIGLVVFGAAEPRAGALVSAARAHETPGLNHRLQVLGGVLEEECRAMMQDFFRARR